MKQPLDASTSRLMAPILALDDIFLKFFIDIDLSTF
jgi:hypothetical protein